MVILSIKLTLLVFYHQLSNWRPLRIAVYVTAAIAIINGLLGMFLWLFQCNTPDMWYHGVDPNQVCPLAGNLLQIALSTGIVNVVTDVMIWLVLLPPQILCSEFC